MSKNNKKIINLDAVSGGTISAAGTNISSDNVILQNDSQNFSELESTERHESHRTIKNITKSCVFCRG